MSSQKRKCVSSDFVGFLPCEGLNESSDIYSEVEASFELDNENQVPDGDF